MNLSVPIVLSTKWFNGPMVCSKLQDTVHMQGILAISIQFVVVVLYSSQLQALGGGK